ncbi:hypothetical protein D8674_032039 [Pyrus ussuriensis x Pyrus communis]|uniref:Uncharacterized protein n=1 Tax=Pyrus ussuriensis x Pyrus communis TaxID=2448454 RepID=A0A5N5F0F6_9ROSA|nr:hypothetical protein D8674_032039 [Pyrus ussuriensis x Pyrus communis]
MKSLVNLKLAAFSKMSRKASRIMVLYIASDNHSSARQRLEWPRTDLFGSDDSNSLEDILRKGFSTGAPMQELLLSRFLVKLKNYPKLKPCLESSIHLVVEIRYLRPNYIGPLLLISPVAQN